LSEALEAKKAIARKYMDAVAAFDGATIMSLVAEDFKIITKGSSVLSGTRTLADLPALMEKMGAKLAGPVKTEILGMIAEGDRVAIEMEGYGMTVDGKAYNNQYLMILHIADGKVHSMTEYMDTRLVDDVFA
jgi:ketosteroid isomerase-like protein